MGRQCPLYQDSVAHALRNMVGGTHKAALVIKAKPGTEPKEHRPGKCVEWGDIRDIRSEVSNRKYNLPGKELLSTHCEREREQKE